MARGNKIGITAALDDQVSSKLDKIRGNFDRLGKTAGAKSILQGVGIGAGISAFGALQSAIGGVVGIVEESIQKSREEEAGISRLDTSLRANVQSYNGNRTAIEAVIAEREKLAFSDGEQRDSLALLVTRTHDVNKALDLEREAMDLARLKGIDLATASEVIGKVYGGNVAVLKRYGIAVDKGATSTQALAQVQKAAAGQAQAFGDTAEGAAQSAKIALDDLEEDIGKEALPLMRDLALFTRDDLVPGIRTLGDVVKNTSLGWETLNSQVDKFTFHGAVTEDHVQGMRKLSHETALELLAQARLGHVTQNTTDDIKDQATEVDKAAAAQRDWKTAIHDSIALINDQKRGHEETSLKIRGVKLDLREARGELQKLSDVRRPTLKQQQDLNDLKLKILEDQDELATLKGDLQTTGKVRQDVTVSQIDKIRRTADLADASVMKLLDDLYRTGGVTPPRASSGSGSGHKQLASGGYLGPGETATVGEAGWETATALPGGGVVVTPHSGGGSGGGPVVIQLHLDGRVIAEVVDSHLYYEAARAPQSPYAG